MLHRLGMVMTRGEGGTFADVQAYFQDLQARGPAWGYYLEHTKSILAVTPGNVAPAKERLHGLGIRVVTGHRYLGGFLGDVSAEKEWLGKKLEGWTGPRGTHLP